MSSFFRIEMLPARHGDALWIEYGTPARTRRILIDGGPLTAYADLSSRLQQLPPGDQGVELVALPGERRRELRERTGHRICFRHEGPSSNGRARPPVPPKRRENAE